MSSTYRDDSVDSMTIAEKIWGGLVQTVEETAAIAEALLFGVLVLHSSTATAADVILDTQGFTCEDGAHAADAVTDAVVATQLVTGKAKIADKTFYTLQVLHTGSASAADEVVDSWIGLTTETAKLVELWQTQRTVSVAITESATLGDSSGQYASAQVAETAQIADAVVDAVLTAEMVDEAVAPGEAWSDQLQAHALVCERAAGATVASGQQAAVNRLCEWMLAGDYATGGEGTGQAWTANNTTWAMSRYAPYAFLQLVVIGGRLYGVAKDGMYALDGTDAPVSASLQTGRVDLGGQAMPIEALMEYAMDATAAASMTVTTTQAGSSATYRYVLARGSGTSLGSGRFEFGRGLRGRHFSFALTVAGKTGEIEDLRIISAQSKRRV